MHSADATGVDGTWTMDGKGMLYAKEMSGGKLKMGAVAYESHRPVCGMFQAQFDKRCKEAIRSYSHNKIPQTAATLFRYASIGQGTERTCDIFATATMPTLSTPISKRTASRRYIAICSYLTGS